MAEGSGGFFGGAAEGLSKAKKKKDDKKKDTKKIDNQSVTADSPYRPRRFSDTKRGNAKSRD